MALRAYRKEIKNQNLKKSGGGSAEHNTEYVRPNDSESSHGRSPAAVDLETVPMMFSVLP